MHKILKFTIITLIALLFSLLAIGRMPQASVITAIILGTAYYIRRKIDPEMRAIILILFSVVFLVMVAISLISYNQTVDTKYYGFSYKGDDYVYGDFGTIVGTLWREGIFPSLKKLEYYNLIGEHPGIQNYQLYNAFIFFMFGGCGGQILLIINCFFHAGIIIPIYFICKNLNIRKKVMSFIFALFLFWPSVFYWSLFNFKEPMMLFIIFASFSLIMEMQDSRPNFFYSAFLVICLCALYLVKTYLFFIIAVPLIVYLIARYRRSYITLVILCSLLFILILKQSLSGSIMPNLYIRLENFPDTVFSIRHSARVSNTPFLTSLLSFTYLRTLLYLPFGIAAVLFLPFLLKPFVITQVFANAESILWWLFLPFCAGGIYLSIKNEAKKMFPMICAFFLWLSILALTQGNMGTLIRQKALIYYIGFIFTGLAVDRALTYMEEAKRGENYIKEIICRGEYHGEYDLVWFVVLENGVEISRHNAKFIETIEWESEPN